MTPIPIQGCTRTLVSPTNFGRPCSDLQIADVMEGQLPLMYSAWKPSMEEITALLLGAPVILGVVGTAHPVVCMSIGEATEMVDDV